MGIRDWLFGEQKQPPTTPQPPPPAESTPPHPVAPQRKRDRFRTIDLPGTWERTATGYEKYQDGIAALPIGPVKVTLRLKPNRANPYGIAAYVGSQQVGWLSTEWNANDPWVEAMTRLDAERIRPRFEGWHKISEVFADHIVYFQFPGRDDLDPSVIADRLIAAAT